MPKSAAAPPLSNDLHEMDFHAWTQEQARAIAERRIEAIDWANVAEEVDALGRAVRGELEERCEILMSYLLKWRQLAEYRGFAWKACIDLQRQEIADLVRECPSLEEALPEAVADGYEDARRRLKYETYFLTSDFPPSCPFSTKDVLDPAYYPEELDAPATGKFPTAAGLP